MATGTRIAKFRRGCVGVDLHSRDILLRGRIVQKQSPVQCDDELDQPPRPQLGAKMREKNKKRHSRICTRRYIRNRKILSHRSDERLQD